MCCCGDCIAAVIASPGCWPLPGRQSAGLGRIAVAHDQLANVAFGGVRGRDASSRAGKAARVRKRWVCVLSAAGSARIRTTGEKAIESDEGKPLK